jgi:hypothetical protein
MNPPDAIIYAPQEPRRSEAVQCGGDVRFLKDGRLQQRFVITEYVGSSVAGIRQEWRDVPVVSDDQ